MRSIPVRTTMTARSLVAAVAIASAVVVTGARENGRRFYHDDPIAREPETQDASKVEEWEIDLFIDLGMNLFGRPGDPAENVRAKNVNTIDEVPDSGWFTNRILARPLTAREVARGPLVGDGPAPGPWTIVAPKAAGVAPGFTMRDSRKDLWFVSLDANGFPEAATGAIAVASRLFWALGYWQAENHLVSVRPEDMVIDPKARFRPPSGQVRSMRQGDLDKVLRRAHQSPDGTYRAIAARALPGRPVGGFRYHGTRPDDPNDVVPHEHRRELRALKVFGAWANLVDMKAGNTLDTVVVENGRSVVRHYLQDVGSTFGTGAMGPRAYDEGWEYLYDPGPTWKRLITLGFFLSPWQTIQYHEVPEIGRFEGEQFDPAGWRPRAATAAFRKARLDDTFWAARRVAAFTEDLITAMVRTAEYSNPSADAMLTAVLMQRRHKILAWYLNAVNPLVDLTLSNQGELSFANAAVDAGVASAPAAGYRASWALFDNTTGQSTPLATPTLVNGTTVAAPAALPSAPGSFVQVQIVANEPAPPSWLQPVTVHFAWTGSSWKLVGLERLP
jgi:hypothetical protein